MPTDFAQQALEILRDGSQFQWYVIPLLALVFYVYTNEISKQNWNVVLAGLAFWGADWINEIVNSIFFHLNVRAPFWGAPGSTAFLILIGLNIEIMFMFSIAGLVWSKMLLPDPKTKILGLPNRAFIALAGSVFCVVVEIWLNQVNALTWDWSWWDANTPWLIFIFGYLWFFVVAFWVHDLDSRKKQIAVVSVIWGIAAVLVLIFGLGLGWI
ncbi:MAG TPA: hypothetical protein DEH25_03110 [Chloroflexi bacterium]|nr:hypothetical protein [Chloroflexota bacterium]HBY08212.1 hypothetical protein [Chloroflexota bacterium]